MVEAAAGDGTPGALDPSSSGPGIGRTLVSARSLGEYESMFALTPVDLRGRVLDCPGGASSFAAEAAAAGAAVVAVDPVYLLSLAELSDLVRSEQGRASEHTARNATSYLWRFHPDVASHRRTRSDSAERFLADRMTRPGRYVAAALPALPFARGAFDLVVSSHFLFTYADRLDAPSHLRALEELCRVSRREVRVYPLVDHAGADQQVLVEELRRSLSEEGIASALRRVSYEFQAGADEMLVLSASRAR